MIEAYIYAFRAYTGDDARAAQQEARGESGAQLRRALQTQLKLSAEQFALFERSALDYDQASRAIQDRIAAVAVADRALYPAQRSLSAAARARIHALFAELLSGQNVAVGSIHRVLDAADAAKMDDAVLALLVEARASGTRRWNHRLARRGGLLGVANTSNLLDLQEAAGTAPLDNPGGDNLCPALTMVEEDEADEACDDDGGLYDLETCDCSIPGGDGGGGGGGAVPDVTVIAWVNASAVALPSGENAALQAYLQNGTALQIAGCISQIGDWIKGDRDAVVTTIDTAYANAWLLRNSGNSQPPSTIVPGAQLSGGNFRLFNDYELGTRVGSTPDPCKTGNITGWYPTAPGDPSPHDGAVGFSPFYMYYQLNEGQIGGAGQLVNWTLNQSSTPWIWSVVEFDEWGIPTTAGHAMFPTYSVYVNGTLTAIYPQSSAAAFIAQNDTYQLTPSQIP